MLQFYRSFSRSASKPTKKTHKVHSKEQSAALAAVVLPNLNPTGFHDKFVEETFAKYREINFEKKQDEIERMYMKMKEACLELEKTDPILFKKAIIKRRGEYFPIERRIPTDTPPRNGWPYKFE
jgi:hypothetical protein